MEEGHGGTYSGQIVPRSWRKTNRMPPRSKSTPLTEKLRYRDVEASESHKAKDMDYFDKADRHTLSRIYAPPGGRGHGREAGHAEDRRHRKDDFDTLSEYDKELFSKTPATTLPWIKKGGKQSEVKRDARRKKNPSNSSLAPKGRPSVKTFAGGQLSSGKTKSMPNLMRRVSPPDYDEFLANQEEMEEKSNFRQLYEDDAASLFPFVRQNVGSSRNESHQTRFDFLRLDTGSSKHSIMTSDHGSPLEYHGSNFSSPRKNEVDYFSGQPVQRDVLASRAKSKGSGQASPIKDGRQFVPLLEREGEEENEWDEEDDNRRVLERLVIEWIIQELEEIIESNRFHMRYLYEFLAERDVPFRKVEVKAFVTKIYKKIYLLWDAYKKNGQKSMETDHAVQMLEAKGLKDEDGSYVDVIFSHFHMKFGGKRTATAQSSLTSKREEKKPAKDVGSTLMSPLTKNEESILQEHMKMMASVKLQGYQAYEDPNQQRAAGAGAGAGAGARAGAGEGRGGGGDQFGIGVRLVVRRGSQEAQVFESSRMIAVSSVHRVAYEEEDEMKIGCAFASQQHVTDCYMRFAKFESLGDFAKTPNISTKSSLEIVIVGGSLDQHSQPLTLNLDKLTQQIGVEQLLQKRIYEAQEGEFSELKLMSDNWIFKITILCQSIIEPSKKKVMAKICGVAVQTSSDHMTSARQMLQIASLGNQGRKQSTASKEGGEFDNMSSDGDKSREMRVRVFVHASPADQRSAPVLLFEGDWQGEPGTIALASKTGRININSLLYDKSIGNMHKRSFSGDLATSISACENFRSVTLPEGDPIKVWIETQDPSTDEQDEWVDEGAWDGILGVRDKSFLSTLRPSKGKELFLVMWGLAFDEENSIHHLVYLSLSRI